VCGELQTAAIKTDGTLWCWGFNLYGRLGDNTTTSRSSPVQTVSGGTNWKEVSSNAGATLMSAIKTDGTLWVWGRGLNGRLGDNTDTDKSSPVQTVAGGTNWKQVSVDASGGAAIYFYDAGDLYPSQ
jgi:alpha-tubulin suppressor-like RCC1 family protein